MKKFEYCTFAIKEVSSADNLPKVLMEGRKGKFPGLRSLGEEGWELISNLTYDRFHRLILKRELQEVTDAEAVLPTKTEEKTDPEKEEGQDEDKDDRTDPLMPKDPLFRDPLAL